MKKNGFSGISDLATNLASNITQEKQNANITINKRRVEDSTNTDIQEEPLANKPAGDNRGLIMFFVCCVLVVLYIVYTESGKQNSVPDTSYKPTSSLQNKPITSQQPPQDTNIQSPSSQQLVCVQPNIGSGKILSVSEIQWCLRQSSALKTFEPLLNTNAKIDKFNNLVNDLNSRCGSYRYRDGDLQKAQNTIILHHEEVKSYPIQIWPELFPRTSVKNETLTKSQIKEIQTILSDLGYKVGIADGIYGTKTKNAIKKFQSSKNLNPDGMLSLDLLHLLRTQPKIKTEQTSSKTQELSNSSYFTLGSSKDEVKKVQGTPSSIIGSTWSYEFSSVYFTNSSTTGKVIGWSNISNNLKIRIDSKQSSQKNYFMLGSSKQEVVNVQGTPSSIVGNTWSYEFSSIYFTNSSPTGKVTGWSNISNNLKVL